MKDNQRFGINHLEEIKMSEETYSGRVSCKGKVEGPVRIIKDYNDLKRVKEGDILVTSQTDVNYVPYLQKSIGLITESGGRYAHASIYSRENNLPCITNVKGALEKLIDSTIVVLDANRNEIYVKV
jgi:phosphoenolpyruvate synthase/pyruvate phosphate dikinase